MNTPSLVCTSRFKKKKVAPAINSLLEYTGPVGNQVEKQRHYRPEGEGDTGSRTEMDQGGFMNRGEKQVVRHQGHSSLTSADCLQPVLSITVEKTPEANSLH